ncbi:MAG: biopolymer transporter ExbD [Phycisphaeraceae bacterium]
MRLPSAIDLSPRVELVPLIDVVFLLLTFFIYSMTVMVRAELLPVELTSLEQGTAAEIPPSLAITLDNAGDLYIDREPSTLAELAMTITTRQAAEPGLRVYIAMEDTSDEQSGTVVQAPVDRGPLLIKVIEQLRAAGVEDVAVVGNPSE